MLRRNCWYVLLILLMAMLPLAGCGGGGGGSVVSKNGYQVTVAGTVGGGKSALKTLFAAAGDLGTITVYNAQDGAVLAKGAVDAAGKFSGLTVSLPSAKSVLVFKAEVSLGGSPFRAIVPIDLSTPPTGLSASNAISISVSQDSTNIVTAVSAMLGVSGLLGDSGVTLASVGKTYTDAAREVVGSGGQVLAYTSGGLVLQGSLSNGSLLPAKDTSSFGFSDLNDITPEVKILSAYIPGKTPIVNFQVTDKANGKGISGLRTFGLHVAKLMPEQNGSSSYWVNYIDKGIAVPAGSGAGATAASKPSADPGTSYNTDGSVKVKGYTVIDHGDGSYTAIFASDITSNAAAPFDLSATHRIGITVTTIALPGLTPTAPVNPATGAVTATFQATKRAAAVYDFVPATGKVLTDNSGKQVFARELVTKEACDGCHYNLAAMSGHFARWNPKLCVICHTSTNTSGEGEFVTLIHRIHMGKDLPVAVQPENVVNPTKSGARTATLVNYAEMAFPQDIRNCTVCHSGADADNWKNKPTRKSCGSCHNDLDFAKHSVADPGDASCAGCHVTAGGSWEVSRVHTTNYDTPHNPGVPAGAANFSYEIKTVTANSANQAVATFRIKKDGAAVTFAPYVAGATAPLAGFTGSPSFYVAFAQPQDGRTAPVDYNNTIKRIRAQSVSLTNVWNGTQGTLSGPDADGYYTAVISGNTTTADTNFPAGARMRTVTLGGSFGQGSFGSRKTRPAIRTVAGDALRRVVVDQAKCEKCHEWLEAHGGGRNDVQFCVQCHNTTNSGFNIGLNSGLVSGVDDAESGSMANMIHRIHRGVDRKTALTFHDTNALTSDIPQKVVYPGMLRNCESCHTPGTYDYTAAQYSSLENFLLSTAQQGVDDNNTGTSLAAAPAPIGSLQNPNGLNKFGFVQYVYGSDNNRVNSVITAACVGCHDSSIAKAHMRTNGGVINGTRPEGRAAVEQCLVCHGTAGNALNATVPSIKAVHRWW